MVPTSGGAITAELIVIPDEVVDRAQSAGGLISNKPDVVGRGYLYR